MAPKPEREDKGICCGVDANTSVDRTYYVVWQSTGSSHDIRRIGRSSLSDTWVLFRLASSISPSLVLSEVEGLA
jgi:hypothetical protein